ncbi:MAG: VWA domain-containing protein [Thermoanaerobaculia bacterium]|nr:VWA domain-containing protein [Thermoanaerobaculia bacterium]
MRAFGVLLLAGFLSPWPASAQEPSPTAVFKDQVEVELIQLELRVNDKKGRPVLDLERADVEVFVDGQKVELAHFELQRPKPSPAKDAPSSPGTAAATVAADDRTFWLALLVDDKSLDGPASRRRVYDGLAALLDAELPQDTRFLLLIEGATPRIASSFTADRASLRRILEFEAAQAPARPQDLLSPSRIFRAISDAWWRMEEGLHTSGCADGMKEMLRHADERAFQVKSRVDQSLATIDWLTNQLAGLPGQKAVLYAGHGLEQQPGIEAFRMIADICPDEEARDVSSYYTRYDRTTVLRNSVRLANARAVTLYTADANGLTGDDQVSLTGSIKARPSSFTQQLEALNRHSGLHQIARDTGGKAVLNANDLAQAFDHLAEDLASFYSVGFYHPRRGDGELHDIGVRIAGRPYDVRYRAQFRDEPEAERIERELLAGLLFGAHGNPLQAELALAPAEKATRATVRVPVGGLTLLPTEQGAHGLVRLVLAVKDAAGLWGSPRQKQVEIDLAPDTSQARAETREIFVDFDLAPGAYTVALAVHDEVGGITSTLEQKVAVAAN